MQRVLYIDILYSCQLDSVHEEYSVCDLIGNVSTSDRHTPTAARTGTVRIAARLPQKITPGPPYALRSVSVMQSLPKQPFRISQFERRNDLPWHDGIAKFTPSLERFEPSLNADTPSTAVRQTPKSMFETRSDQVVSAGTCKVKEFLCHNGGYGVRIRIEGGVVAVSHAHEAYPGSKIAQSSTKDLLLIYKLQK